MCHMCAIGFCLFVCLFVLFCFVLFYIDSNFDTGRYFDFSGSLLVIFASCEPLIWHKSTYSK